MGNELLRISFVPHNSGNRSIPDVGRTGPTTCCYALPMLAFALALATMVVPVLSEPELRAQADVVVDGVVVRQEVHRLGQRVFTFSTVLVGSGVTATSYLVALPGGDVVVNGQALSQRVPGAPQLQLAQRYRLYLGKPDGPPAPGSRVSSRGVVGFFRGVFLIDGAHNDALVPFADDGQPHLQVAQ